MKISQYYAKNVNLGNYETARIGITLEKEIENPTKVKIENVSKQLNKLAKELVEKQLKEEVSNG